jgi:eukaryotic-like serine/threonine-protein kinase
LAVKELLTSDPAARSRFEREAQIAARLQHPSIVTIDEAGVGPEVEPFYEMPQVPGSTLADALRVTTTLAHRLAFLPQVIGVCEPVGYATSNRSSTGT